MGYLMVVMGVMLLYLLVRVLHLASRAAPPDLTFLPGEFNNKILGKCPMLLEQYIPTLMWGKSGHLQTIIYAKLGRIKSPYPEGRRFSNVMSDGATSTFDVFEPLGPQENGGDITMVVCPGIANSSESIYIRTFSHNAQQQGFRVAVLNHLGALTSVRLTSPRIFTYGGTAEYGAMVKELQKLYPDTKMIAVGFSMGGNITVKYLAESPEHQKHFLCAVSCCQGYDISRCGTEMTSWENLRRIYGWAMTLSQKALLRRHMDILFGVESQKLHGRFDLERILTSTNFLELDDAYSRRRAGYERLEDYYRDESCSPDIHKVTLPMLIINALDDPIVPESLLEWPRKHAATTKDTIFCLTEHGGHLGYFMGGTVLPEPVTWIDKVIVQYANAVVKVQGHMS